MTIRLILLDADDTLWHNMRHFDEAQRAFLALMAPAVDAGVALETLATVEVRNLRHYGYGAKSFTLSMIETAIELAGDRLSISDVAAMLAAGRTLLSHPVELLEDVGATVERLAELGQLALLTKGDLLHQEAKLAASGLGGHFAAVEIVSDKNADTFRTLFARLGIAPEEAIMAGDSLRSDIVPALEAGAWAAFIPQEGAWSHEHAPEPLGHPRYHRLARLAELPALIDRLN